MISEHSVVIFLASKFYVQIWIFFLAILHTIVLIVIVYDKLSLAIVLQKMFTMLVVYTKGVLNIRSSCDSCQMQQWYKWCNTPDWSSDKPFDKIWKRLKFWSRLVRNLYSHKLIELKLNLDLDHKTFMDSTHVGP